MILQGDSCVSSMVSPAFSLALMHIDTAFTAAQSGYFQSDCEWFRQHRKRITLLRRESIGEFGPADVPQTHPALSVFLAKPYLWVLVVRIMPGTHVSIPVYRGAAFWQEMQGDYPKSHVNVPAIASDEEMAAILIEMQRRNGVNLQEQEEWSLRCVMALQEKQQRVVIAGTAK